MLTALSSMQFNSSSDGEGADKTGDWLTPPRKRLEAHGLTPINERRAMRKVRRRHSNPGLHVLEGQLPIDSSQPSQESGFDEAPENVASQPASSRPGRPKKDDKCVAVDPAVALAAAIRVLQPGFAENFFLSKGCEKLHQGLAMNVTKPGPEAPCEAERPDGKKLQSWKRLLYAGFSLLVQGVGSKREVLQEFASSTLKPAGIRCVHCHAFDARFSLCDILRQVLEQVYPQTPRQGISAENLAATVKTAVATPGSRELCFIVHHLENLPRNHLAALASMNESPGIHVVASIDNMWAPMSWDSQIVSDLNFVFIDVHTFASQRLELVARHGRGLPAWCGLGKEEKRSAKATLGIVMRSLTDNHRELVQAMAQKQLETENNTGIPMPVLLKVSIDRMIALDVSKLKNLLKELLDHEVVVQRGCSSTVTSQALFGLPFDARTLEKLADGETLDSDDEGADGEGRGGNEGADEDGA